MPLAGDTHDCCSCVSTNLTPTPRTHTEQEDGNSKSDNNGRDGAGQSHDETSANPSSQQSSSSTAASVIYIVTDTSYPTATSFESNIGTTIIESVYSGKSAANARAKKIMFENGHRLVDIDKIIEEQKNGLYTGIGIGGKEGGIAGSCYARRCQVEGKIVDEDSEVEDEGSGEGADDDVDMG